MIIIIIIIIIDNNYNDTNINNNNNNNNTTNNNNNERVNEITNNKQKTKIKKNVCKKRSPNFCLACIAERDYRRRFSDGGGGGVVNIEILTKVKFLKCHHNLGSIWT